MHALKSKIEQMLHEATKKIMVTGWLDTSLLDILQKKHAEGVSIRIITKRPESGSPQPTRTAYRKLVDIAEVRRNELWHFRLIVCDDKEALVTSSDLTTHSLSQNFEAGVWTCSPMVVNRAIKLFEKVWQHAETKDVNQELKRKS
jgi:phosphatidylserine/phosphatidylglycerophosphate/cardiolipin synthase-like enzyme